MMNRIHEICVDYQLKSSQDNISSLDELVIRTCEKINALERVSSQRGLLIRHTLEVKRDI